MIRHTRGCSSLTIHSPTVPCVGVTGLEPVTSCVSYRCATKLRHTPIVGVTGLEPAVLPAPSRTLYLLSYTPWPAEAGLSYLD